jgi:hypothetical protein
MAAAAGASRSRVTAYLRAKITAVLFVEKRL